ncbi:MAG: glycerate kinase [Bacillota bacterium]
MRILIASDSFKGSLTSQEVGAAVTKGILRVCPEAEIAVIPMADGGEGTVQALIAATGGQLITTEVTGPLGAPVEARFGLLPEGTAVLEMAEASGLTLVPEGLRNPMVTTTYGTGELILKALDSGANRIIIGIGGSATNDGGAGMAQALGVSLKDASGQELPHGGGSLGRLAEINMSGLDPRIKTTPIIVACDVKNPLCGPNGAAAIYGPQKGASPEMIKLLDANLRHFAQVIAQELNQDVMEIPGAGAAGGLGAGLIAFAGAELRSGVESVLDTVKLENYLTKVDLVITGEGRLDHQSAFGKVPVGVAKRAASYGVPVIALVGEIGPGAHQVFELGINSAVTLVNGPMGLQQAMEKASDLLADAAERTMRLILVGKIIGGKTA